MRYLAILAALLAGCGGPADPQSLEEGKALLAAGKHEAAVAALSKATAEDRNSMQAWLHLGHAYAALKRHDNALAAYVAAKKIDRHAIAPHLAHAKVQMELGHIEQATSELNFVVEMDAKNIEALLLLARVSQMPHKLADGSVGVTRASLERAELNLEAVTRLDPNNAAAIAELESVRRKLSSTKETR